MYARTSFLNTEPTQHRQRQLRIGVGIIIFISLVCCHLLNYAFSHRLNSVLNSPSFYVFSLAETYFTPLYLVSLIISYIADMLIKKSILATAVVRKVANTLAHIGPAVCLALITVVVSNDEPQMTFTLAMFTVGVGCMGALYSSWIINPQVISTLKMIIVRETDFDEISAHQIVEKNYCYYLLLLPFHETCQIICLHL